MIARMPGATYMTLIGGVWFILQGVLTQTAPTLRDIYADMNIELSGASAWFFDVFQLVANQFDRLGTAVGLTGLAFVGLVVLGLLMVIASKARPVALLFILLFMGSALVEMFLLLSPMRHIAESITELG